MPIEVWGSDDAGHLMLMPDPLPGRDAAAEGAAAAPPAPDTPPGEPPLQPEAPPSQAPPPADDLTALRRMIEAREARDRERDLREAQRDARVDTLTKVVRGEDLTPPAAPDGPPARPTAEAFTSQDDYYEAVADWKAEAKLTAFRQEQQQAQLSAQQQQAQLTMDQRVKQAEDAFVTAHPDYVEVVTQGLVAKTPPAFRQLIMLSDDAPAVAYALAKDEALLGRLMQLPPPQLLYALGRLSGQHGGSAPPPAGTPPVPPAGALPPAGGLPVGSPKPPPPRPLSGTGVAPVGGFRDDMSMAEYRQWKKQHHIQ